MEQHLPIWIEKPRNLPYCILQFWQLSADQNTETGNDLLFPAISQDLLLMRIYEIYSTGVK